MGLDLSPDALRMVIVKMIILILSIAVHEFGHAIMADRLGDDLPRSQGRVTLNPIAHADPIGTLMLPALGLLLTGGASIGFGWGRPVQINPRAFTRRLRTKVAHMFVAAAGPGMNIGFGLFISIVWFFLVKYGALGFQSELHAGIHTAIQINFVLAFFNLIPAPPLDGGSVLAGLLPDRMQPAYRNYAQYGIFVVLAFMMIPTLSAIFLYPARKLYLGWITWLMGYL
jgi:Zn-dependent protease